MKKPILIAPSHPAFKVGRMARELFELGEHRLAVSLVGHQTVEFVAALAAVVRKTLRIILN